MADRPKAAVKEKGLSMFNRIDHEAGTRKIGIKIHTMDLIIFGSPARARR